MLNTFRLLRSNLLEDDERSRSEELSNLLTSSISPGDRDDPNEAPVSANSLFTGSTTSTLTVHTASGSIATNGVNPQDDLEQPPKSTAATDGGESCNTTPTSANNSSQTAPTGLVQPRKQPQALQASSGKSSMIARRRGRRRKRRHRAGSNLSDKDKELIGSPTAAGASGPSGPIEALCSMCLKTLCFDRTMVRNTLSCMNVMARVVVWSSVVALVAGVVWYSYELKNNGTDPHLIAWFSAGAFVLLGFPLSMGSIVAHLANYNQPHVQCYIVRILWMVPLYSMESWLCLRFHEYAIYIETLRDCYESFVLYSFLQFLIEVLGGEEALILMLKDKSPTRGSHMWGLQWCVKPWLMGQPVRRSEDDKKSPASPRDRHQKSLKRVQWTSPFFVKCKFGVLQYVLLKFVCSFLAMILETHGIYKEGDFTYKGGYLYICVVTNVSQCWALYCLILFYYATHNELGPIRPVGKFLSVKALVFFTWWQSVAIGILYQMNLIPEYKHSKTTIDMSREDVAKGIQDYLICVEMFFAAICHTLVFPHTEYSPQAVQARARALNQSASNPSVWQQRKRLGRHHQYHTNQVLRNYHHNRDDKSANSESKSSFTAGDRSFFDLEMTTLSSGGAGTGTQSWEETETVDDDGNSVLLPLNATRLRGVSVDSVDSDLSPMASPVNRQEWGSSQQKPYPGWEGLTAADDELHETRINDPNGRKTLLQPSLQERHGTIQEGHDEDAQWEPGDYDEEEDFSSEGSDDTGLLDESSGESRPRQKQSFVRAFLDSAIPRDLRDNTVGIVKGDYVVEKKTLLHHATTSDHYDLFSPTRRPRPKYGKGKK